MLRCFSMITFVDEQKLLEYLKAYDNQFLYQKAGFILSYFQKSMKINDIFFEKCKTKIKKSVRYLYAEINFTVFNLPRLSVDIDLDYCADEIRE